MSECCCVKNGTEGLWKEKDVPMEKLLERVEKICNDPRFEDLRSNPKDVSVMVVTDSDRPFLSRYFNMDLVSYFKDPMKRLEFQLKTKIFHYENFKDDFIIDNVISLDYGMYLEAGFWTQLIYAPDADPWISETEPEIKDIRDIEKLRYPDFYKDGVMPQIHEAYKLYKERFGDRLNVTLPSWYRNPWAVARHLRGFENLVYDAYEYPELVHKFLKFLVDSRKKYTLDWCSFHDVTISKSYKAPFVNGVWMVISDLSSDEVSCPGVSPDLYEEFIAPYEMMLAEFYGGINYYHSCGDLTDLIPKIKRLPGLEVFHVGPWTDIKTASRELNDNITLQVCLFAERDIFNATEEQMRKNIQYILENRGEHKVQIIADSFGDGSLTKIKRWFEIAKEEVSKACK